MDKINIVFYLFIIIFSITALITFLGITNIITTIKEKYLNALFYALIIEVIGAVVFSYKQIDLTSDRDSVIEDLSMNTQLIEDSLPPDKKVDTLRSLLRCCDDLRSENMELKQSLSVYLDSLEKTSGDIVDLDKVFYSNVIKLRLKSERIKGRTINLIWRQEEKGEIFAVLKQIFIELGYVDPNKEFTNHVIIQTYIDFLKDNGLQYLLKKNDSGGYNQVLIDEYATAIFLRKFLNRKYPLHSEE